MSRTVWKAIPWGTWFASVILVAANAGTPKTETAHEIWHDIYGKECMSKAGAHFTFARDGRYTYSGLWPDSGRYTIHSGGIFVRFDNGLARDFSISREGERLLMEETGILCIDKAKT